MLLAVFFLFRSEQHLSRKALVAVSLYQLIFMSEPDLQIPSAFDPFAEANAEDSGQGQKSTFIFVSSNVMVGKA
ncbi:hypothetical protein HanRHA438_Chr04g0171791 [Helianthus annuus]|nr:hypothetical protein HanRHA438_Chr04g0171791 [Helianthus annuus]